MIGFLPQAEQFQHFSCNETLGEEKKKELILYLTEEVNPVQSTCPSKSDLKIQGEFLFHCEMYTARQEIYSGSTEQ